MLRLLHRRLPLYSSFLGFGLDILQKGVGNFLATFLLPLERPCEIIDLFAFNDGCSFLIGKSIGFIQVRDGLILDQVIRAIIVLQSIDSAQFL